MMSAASSTLVETVSINYEDFNESFLTCSTCLCMYDGQEHTPKLLSCSHTVCRICLERIAEGVGVRDAGSFRCPICRETIPMPRGGIGALPPSFLVNQLLDLMSRQRREVIPKCSTHPSQELMFCETCDCVFCTLCNGGVHKNGNGSCDHTIIPFSTAIKRMSEILLYKAQLCIEKLGMAAENVNIEIEKLERNSVKVLRVIDQSFLSLFAMVEKRKEEILEEAQNICREKKNVLEEQLRIIETEKDIVERQCTGLQYQVEIRNITTKISELNEKINSIGILIDPRENAYMKFEVEHNAAFNSLKEDLSAFGSLQTSKTLPSLSFADIHETSAHLLSSTTLQTVDYHGVWQSTGGDPVMAKLQHESGDTVKTEITDSLDGTYEIKFTPNYSGNHLLHISIFDRPIKGSPFSVKVSEHINPVARFGSRGSGEHQLMQPVGIISCSISSEGFILVTDTGNSRILVLNLDLEPIKLIRAPGLEDRAGTGLALTLHDTLLVINWRYKNVTQISFNGDLISQFTHAMFLEPIDLAINSLGHVLIADNGVQAIFMLDLAGKMLKIVRQPAAVDSMHQITSICCGPKDEIIIAGRIIRIFNSAGEFMRDIGYLETRGKGLFGGVCYDGKGNLLATHTGKSKSRVFVYNFSSAKLSFIIDSESDKLKRPSGIAINADHHLFVVDLGNDCIKKYRYY